MAKHSHFGRMRSQRQLRVGEALRRIIAPLVSCGLADEPELQRHSITVGEVRVSPDLRRATVYVLPLGGEQAEEIVEALNRNRADIRRQMNREISLKYSPSLHFELDRTFDQMEETRRLLERARTGYSPGRGADSHGQ